MKKKLTLLPLVLFSFILFSFIHISADEPVNELKESNVKISWQLKDTMPSVRFSFSAVTSDNKIYAVGGYTKNASVFEKLNYEYDPVTGQCVIKEEMLTGRSNLALANIGDNIYAIGGDRFLNKNERYSISSNKWTTMTPMPTGRQHVSCAVVDEKIYVIGGLEDINLQPKDYMSDWTGKVKISDKNERYDEKNDSWLECAPIPTPRHGAGLVAHKDKIYVMGGCSDNNALFDFVATNEVYDPRKDEWNKLKNVPYPMALIGIESIGDYIVVIGGQKQENNKDIVFSDVLVYDPDNDVWFKSDNLPVELTFTGTAICNGKIYVMGGCNARYSPSSLIYEGEIEIVKN